MKQNQAMKQAINQPTNEAKTAENKKNESIQIQLVH